MFWLVKTNLKVDVSFATKIIAILKMRRFRLTRIAIFHICKGYQSENDES